MQTLLKSAPQVAKQSAKFMTVARVPQFALRTFGHTKYTFDDEDWKPNMYQVSYTCQLDYSKYCLQC